MTHNIFLSDFKKAFVIGLKVCTCMPVKQNIGRATNDFTGNVFEKSKIFIIRVTILQLLEVRLAQGLLMI
jgi:hypothetical protein